MIIRLHVIIKRTGVRYMDNNDHSNKITRHLNKINSLLNELQKIDSKTGLNKIGPETTIPPVPESKEEDQFSNQPSAPVFLLSSMPEFRKKVKEEKIKKDNANLVQQLKKNSDKKPS
jgi:hypothetical protein